MLNLDNLSEQVFQMLKRQFLPYQWVPNVYNCMFFFVRYASKKPYKRKNGKTPVFMEGVPGVEVFNEQPKAFHLQKKVQVMCEWKRLVF